MTAHPPLASDRLLIRQAQPSDYDAIWQIFAPIAQAGQTYAFRRDINQQQALDAWVHGPEHCYVAEMDGQILGTYYLKTNQQGPGCHVCNCGYMVSEKARGMGVATLMCQHSLQLAGQSGYKAMQFNFVAQSNRGAIRLWQKLGFEIVGTLPNAFNHAQLGLIDALVMYQWLAD